VRTLAEQDVCLEGLYLPVWDIAAAEAARLGHGRDGTDHLVLAVLALPVPGIAPLLEGHGIDLVTARQRVAELRAAERPEDRASRPIAFGTFGAPARSRTWLRSPGDTPWLHEADPADLR
jgi:hypothetical protein